MKHLSLQEHQEVGEGVLRLQKEILELCKILRPRPQTDRLTKQINRTNKELLKLEMAAENAACQDFGNNVGMTLWGKLRAKKDAE